MGTREVYEEKLRSGAHLHRNPTINPGLGSPRCPRCLSLLNPTAGEGDWAITSVLHDATAVAGSGAGALLSAVHGFNTGFRFVQKHVKGPKWLQLLVGVPPLLMFSGASAVFGAYALPTFAQLTVTSYYVASSGSHYAVSQITRQIERAHLSDTDEKSRSVVGSQSILYEPCKCYISIVIMFFLWCSSLVFLLCARHSYLCCHKESYIVWLIMPR